MVDRDAQPGVQAVSDLLGDQLVGGGAGQRRELGQHRRAVAGVAVDQPVSAARADATAVSTSAVVASAYSVTTAPFAG